MNDVNQILIDLRLDGWSLIEDVIPQDRVEEIRERILQVVIEQSPNYRTAPENIGFVPGLINHDQSFAAYLADRRLTGVAEALFGPHFRISFTSAIINLPGNERGKWHADWPFNQEVAGRIPAPYPDVCQHLTTLWMLSPFTGDNGGTFLVSGSHRTSNNPTGDNGVALKAPYRTEMQARGPSGSVLLFDSRLWHATAPNESNVPRVALAVRYAPKWLNLEVLMPGSDERRRLVDEAAGTENVVPPVSRAVYESLPDHVKPLYRHWVREEA